MKLFFGIKDYERHINVSDKDTFNILDRNISLIKIKKGIPDNKKKFVSAGLYYFKNLKLFEELNKKSIQKNLFDKSNYQIGHLMKNSLQHQNISYSFVNNFVDLGNNKKLEEYFFWLKFFKNKFFSKDTLKTKKILNIIPAAGEGSRHKKLGYNMPKPLIPISGKTMFENSIDRLPNKKENFFIFRKKTFNKYNINRLFLKNNNLKNYFLINKKTQGMAETILLAKDKLSLNKPSIVSSCDISFIINYKKFYKILKKDQTV